METVIFITAFGLGVILGVFIGLLLSLAMINHVDTEEDSNTLVVASEKSSKYLYDRIFTPIINWFPDFNHNDKVVHALFGFVASYATSFISKLFGFKDVGYIVGFLASVIAGIIKEVLDYQRSKKIKPENVYDFLSTILGGAIASGIIYLTINNNNNG